MKITREIFKKQELWNTIWQLTDKIITFVCGMVLMIQLANHYGATHYGEYQYIISIVAIYELVLGFIDVRVVLKKYDKYGQDCILFNVLIVKAVLSVLLGVIAMLSIPFMMISNESVKIFWLLIGNAIVVSIRFGPNTTFLRDLDVKRNVIASDLGIVISFIWQLYAVFSDKDLTYIALSTFISNVIVTCVIYMQYYAKYKWNKKECIIDNQFIKDVLRESFPLTLATAVYIVYTKTDSLMVGKLLSVEAVAIYSIAVKLISVIELLIAPIQNTTYLRMINLYQSNLKEYEYYYIRMTSLVTWILIIGGLVSVKILPFIMRIFNQEYADALGIYNILLIGVLFAYNGMLRAGHITLVNQGRILTISNIITMILNLGLNYVLITSLGMKGAAIATVIVKFVCIEGSNVFFVEGRKLLIWQLKAFNPIYMIRGFRGEKEDE